MRLAILPKIEVVARWCVPRAVEGRGFRPQSTGFARHAIERLRSWRPSDSVLKVGLYTRGQGLGLVLFEHLGIVRNLFSERGDGIDGRFSGLGPLDGR